jgi:hypothetical protein
MRRLSRFLTGLLLVLFVLALAFWYGGRWRRKQAA